MSARSAASCCVKPPVIRPSVVIRPSMRGADCTRPSSTIASWRPMFSPVIFAKRREPSLLSVKLTAGWLFSSSVGRAVRRSRPVTAAAARTT